LAIHPTLNRRKTPYRNTNQVQDIGQKTKLAESQTITPKIKYTFHPRIINITEIQFTKSKTELLLKGLKYNIHAKQENWLQALALEAETAITQLPQNERDVYRKLVADRLETLQRQKNTNPNPTTYPESKLIR
jgi:hypothetical protein